MKKLLSIVLILIVLLWLSVDIVNAKKTENYHQEEEEQFSNYIGFGAGLTKGYGISYRYMLNDNWGFQTNFAPYYDESRTRVSLGISFIYKLIESEHIDLFFYQGNHYHYSKDEYITLPIYPPEPRDDIYKSHTFHHGIGFGLDFIIRERVAISLMGGFGAVENFSVISIVGGAGIYFRF